MGLWLLCFSDCRFEYCRSFDLSLVTVAFCQVEVSASDRSLVKRHTNGSVVSEYDHTTSIMRRSWLTRVCCSVEKKVIFITMAHNCEIGNIVFTSFIKVTRFKKDSAANTRSHVILMLYFPWSPVEDALSIFHVSLLC